MIVVPILLLLGAASAQFSNDRAFYLGTLGDSAVQMELIVDGDTLTGWYQVDGIGLPLDLEGTLGPDRVLVFDERSDGVITGTFDGILSTSPDQQGITITGSWRSPAGQELPFRLERVAEYSSLELRQGRIDAHRSLPFFISADLSPLNPTLHAEALAELTEFFEAGQDMLVTGEFHFRWTLDENTAIHYLDTNFLSARSSTYSYTGGAHGNTFYRAFNLHLVDGTVHETSLGDLFTPGSSYLTPLSDYVLDDLRRQEAYDVAEGMITELTEDDLAVFTLSPAGLTFAFAPYHVGPYAQGSFFVTVPLEVVAAYAAGDGPLAALVTGR